MTEENQYHRSLCTLLAFGLFASLAVVDALTCDDDAFDCSSESTNNFTLSYVNCGVGCNTTVCCGPKPYGAGAKCGDLKAVGSGVGTKVVYDKCPTDKTFNTAAADSSIDADTSRKGIDDKCCAPRTCANAGANGVPYQCPAGQILKVTKTTPANPKTIPITDANLVMAASLCCVPRTCAKLSLNAGLTDYNATFTCPSGKVPAYPAPQITSGDGTADICCVNRTCANGGSNSTPYTCQGSGMVLVQPPPLLPAGAGNDSYCCRNTKCQADDCPQGYILKLGSPVRPAGDAATVRAACCVVGTSCAVAGPSGGPYECSKGQTSKNGTIPTSKTLWSGQNEFCCSGDKVTCGNVASFACPADTVTLVNATLLDNTPVTTAMDTSDKIAAKCCEAATRTCSNFTDNKPFVCARGQTLKTATPIYVANSLTAWKDQMKVCCAGDAETCNDVTVDVDQSTQVPHECPSGTAKKPSSNDIYVMPTINSSALVQGLCCEPAKTCANVGENGTPFTCGRGQTLKSSVPTIPNSILTWSDRAALCCNPGTAPEKCSNAKTSDGETLFTCPAGKDFKPSALQTPILLGWTDAKVEEVCCGPVQTCASYQLVNGVSQPYACPMGTLLKANAATITPIDGCCDGTAVTCDNVRLSDDSLLTCDTGFTKITSDTSIPAGSSDDAIRNLCCGRTCATAGPNGNAFLCPLPLKALSAPDPDAIMVPNAAGTLLQRAAVCCEPGTAITCATVNNAGGSPFQCPAGKSFVTNYAGVAIPQTAVTDADIEQECCASCPAAQYTDAAGEVVCKSSCPVTNMVPKDDKTGCQCPAGFAYTPATSSQPATCEACPASTFNPTVGSSTTATTCAPCPVTGQVSYDKVKCVCPLGFGWSATSKTCSKCPAGMLSDTVDSPCKNATCAAPMVLSKDQTGCVCGSPFETSGSPCVCPAGYGYNDTSNPKACTPCGNGMYNSKSNSACQACNKAGRVVNADHTDCVCGANFQDVAGTCTCPKGFKLSNTTCSLCPAGTFTETTNSANCSTTCSKPNMVPMNDRTGCECAENFKLVDGACVCRAGFAYTPSTTAGQPGTCILCSSGTYNTKDSAATGTVATNCTACPISNQVANTLRTACVCPKGFLWSAANKTCSQCPVGKYSASEDSTSCSGAETCPALKEVAADQTGCVCKDGFVADGDNCVCPKGSAYTPANGNITATCIPCEGSTYNEVLGSGTTATRCMDCELPKMVNSNRSECGCGAPFKKIQETALSDPVCACPKGYAFDADALTCTPCTAGTYNDILGISKSTTCKTTCPNWLGEVVRADRTGCECGDGFIPSQDGCVCPKGSAFDASAGTCTECPDGTYNSIASNLASTFCKPCSTPGLTQSNSDKSGCACPAGYAFTPGSGLNPATCAQCPEGYYNSHASNGAATTCTQCVAPKTLSTDRTSCICSNGYHKEADTDQCNKCPLGMFSSSTTDSYGCNSCPAPMLLSADQSECTCPKGSFLDGNNKCNACPSGRYSDTVDATTCKICEASHILAADQSSCKCPATDYENSNGVCVPIPTASDSNPQQGVSETPTVATTYELSFGLSSGSFKDLENDATKMTSFKNDLAASIAAQTGISQDKVTIGRVWEGSIHAEVTIVAANEPAIQTALQTALTTNPASLFSDSFVSAYGIDKSKISGSIVAGTCNADCRKPMQIGIGVGLGVGGAIGLAGVISAILVARRAKQAVHVA